MKGPVKAEIAFLRESKSFERFHNTPKGVLRSSQWDRRQRELHIHLPLAARMSRFAKPNAVVQPPCNRLNISQKDRFHTNTSLPMFAVSL